MDKALEQEVRRRAGNRCEYCRLPQFASCLAFVIDHIIARQHGGDTTLGNLALACGCCNRHKGPNIAGLDPSTQRLTPLFHPRQDSWAAHFRYDGATLVGLTPIGRTTIAVLSLNQAPQVALREALLDEGRFGNGEKE